MSATMNTPQISTKLNLTKIIIFLQIRHFVKTVMICSNKKYRCSKSKENVHKIHITCMLNSNI